MNFLEKYKPEKLNEIKGNNKSIKELNYDIIEVNASDYRDKESVERIIGESSQQYSLFKKGRIILVDEIDGLNLEDRGGAQALASVISKSIWPIIMTCNDPFNSNLKNLVSEKELEDIEFGDREHKESIFNALRLIFKSKDPILLLDILSKTDLDLDECILWL